MSKRILLSIASLILSSLACTMYIGGPEYPETQIPISTETAASVEELIDLAVQTAQETGVLTISISEAQLTSLIAAKMAAEQDPFLTEPQVYLRNGEIQIYGKATQGNFAATVRIVLSATVDANGQPKIAVVSTDLGPLPAPDGLNNSISAVVNEAFTGGLGPAAIGFRLETITIADGLMTLAGRIK
jgi:uncharacterized protein YpmS